MSGRTLSELREEVWRANRALVSAGLVALSFGNASGIDRSAGVMLIKPSGVPCDGFRPEDLVAVPLDGGTVEGGALRPSSDTPTHLALYRRYPSIGGVVHTHSTEATAWAQAGRSIPPLGTTHADHFHGPVPVTRQLTATEIAGEYELETGRVIIETIDELGFEALEMPAVLVASHGPFVWGATPTAAADNAIALEIVAAAARRTFLLVPSVGSIGDKLLERHYRRKHGPAAYYGQVRR